MRQRGSSEGSVIRYVGRRGITWRIRFRDASGRRVIETLGPEPPWSERRARAELRHRLTDVERDGYVSPVRTTFAEFAERWMRDYLPVRGLKPTTVETYRYALARHLLPFFGSLNLAEITPEAVDRYLAQKIGEGLSPKTVTNHLMTLGVMLKQAVRWRLLRANPAADVERPRIEESDLRVLREDEIALLWNSYAELEQEAPEAERAWWRLARTITFVALGTAMRRGELLGLRWKDVRMVDGLVQVREAWVRSQFTAPKSKASRRTIELGSRTRELLEAHWRRTAFGKEDDLVFCHPQSGQPLEPGTLVRHYLRPALRRASIPDAFRPFHDLRHTALTHEAAAGNPQAYVQLRAGHSQGSITERYIHSAQVLFPGAAQRGEDRLFGNLPRRPQNPAEPAKE